MSKICKTCGKEWPLTNFHKNGKSPDGRQHKCKPCAAKHKKQWKLDNMARDKFLSFKSSIKRLYGLSVDRYFSILESQEGACDICKKMPEPHKRLHVDHIHGTEPKVIRGLLCGNCNTMIGLAKENEDTLKEAVKYLGKKYV